MLNLLLIAIHFKYIALKYKIIYRRQIGNANVPMQYNINILLTKWDYINICFHFFIENIR